MTLRTLLAALAAWGLLAVARADEPAREVPLLSAALDEFAKELVQTMADLNETQVSVGDFTPTGFDANPGQGIAQELSTALERAKKGCVTKQARYQIKGDVAFVESAADPKQRVIQLDFRVIDVRSGKLLGNFAKSARVNGTKEIARIVQVDTKLDPEGTKEERNYQIRDALEHPQVCLKGSKVKTKADSPYAVELVVKDAGGAYEPKSAEDHAGHAFVGLDKDDVYRVRIHNASAKEVAVSVFVDGISNCQFSAKKKADGKPSFEHFIVEAGKAQDVVGWFVDAKDGHVDYKEFLVTENGKGAVSKLPTKARGKVGVVTVAFAHCFEPVPGGRSGAETGFGAPIRVVQKPIKREFDVPHEFVNIRYAR